MAYERKSQQKTVGDSLDAFVSNISDTFSKQITVRNTSLESDFQNLALSGSLSLNDQLEYRQSQLSQVTDDRTETARIKGEISSLKEQITQKNFSDAYTDKLVSYESGISSIDNVIDFLNQQKAATNDPTMLSSITKEILTQTTNKYNQIHQLLNDQTSYALNNKGVSVLTDQISKVTTAKVKAMAAGDDATAANLDLQLQSLNKSLAETNITNSIQTLASSSISGAASATALLDGYNSKINSSSPSSGPITIGGHTYDSEADFWTYTRDSYVSDQSASGFFDRVKGEVSDQISVADSKGLLTPQLLQNYTSQLSSLGTRPELAGFTSKITATTQDLLQTGANMLADTITDNYKNSLDLNTAVSQLNSLKALGVNVDSAYTKILTDSATVKNQQVSSILSAVQTAMANDPSMTPEKAINQALASGAAAVLSPDELAKNSAPAIAKDLSKSAAAGTAKDNPNLTIQPPVTTPTPAAATTTTPSTSGFNTITIQAGQTLSQIASQHGTTVQDLVTANGISNPDKIQAGATLKIPTKTTSSIAAPIQTPTPTPVITPAPKPVVTTPTPSPAVTPTAPKVVSPTPTPVTAPTPTTPAPTKPVTYTIKSGDTLSRIAQTYGTTVANLAGLNGIANPDKIQAGATIKIK